MENKETIIYFEDGIYGFEDIREYILLQEDNDGTVWSLQAAHSPIPSLIVLNPLEFAADYHPRLSEADSKYFGDPVEEDLCFLCVAILKEDPTDLTINLKSPIVIHVNTRKARQVILENGDYPIRFKPFANKSGEGN